MALYLVRHASAGERGLGPDDLKRPLDAIGEARAQQLAVILASHAVAVMSSPAIRCRQTVAPLAKAIGVPVVDTVALLEGSDFEPVVALLEMVADGTVLCSHGDVIPETIEALARRGMGVVGQPSWKKGSVWVVERGADGSFVSGHVLKSAAALTSRDQ